MAKKQKAEEATEAPKKPNDHSALSLPNIVELLPEIKKVREKNQGPSCSLSEALNKQDLFINSTLANLGMNILWKMFREARLSYHGLYLNLDSMAVNPIKIQ